MLAPHILTPVRPFLRESPSAPIDRSHLSSARQQRRGCSFKLLEYPKGRIAFVVECRLGTKPSARCL